MTIETRLAMLQGIAEDEDVKMTQRLRALEEIGRIEREMAAKSGAVVDDESGRNDAAPDPMADLDEMETARLKRQRRAA